MKRKKLILTAALLSASIGLGAQSVLAQTAPGGPAVPSNPRGPGVPQPEPNLPREIQPTIPGQPAPGIPQTDPMPGRPGTIPERVQRPNTSNHNMTVTSDDIRKAQDAPRAKGLNPGTDGTMDAKTQQALRELNVTLARLSQPDVASTTLALRFREYALPRLFDLREIWLRVMSECRQDEADDTPLDLAPQCIEPLAC